MRARSFFILCAHTTLIVLASLLFAHFFVPAQTFRWALGLSLASVALFIATTIAANKHEEGADVASGKKIIISLWLLTSLAAMTLTVLSYASATWH